MRGPRVTLEMRYTSPSWELLRGRGPNKATSWSFWHCLLTLMYSSGDAPSTSLDEVFYFDSCRLTDGCIHFLGDPFLCGAPFAMADPLSTYPGGFAPRRAPWETTASHQGLWLDDLGELAFPIHFDQTQAQQIPIDQISADLEGFCFATLTSLANYFNFRAMGTFVFVTKGYICQRESDQVGIRR